MTEIDIRMFLKLQGFKPRHQNKVTAKIPHSPIPAEKSGFIPLLRSIERTDAAPSLLGLGIDIIEVDA